jgi:hypothetical protein
MADPIEAHYTPDGDDWAVAVRGRGRTLTGRATGLIAARDKADQLVEQIAPDESGHKTVVHLLNGDAVEFTTAYLTARLARTEEPPAAPVAPVAEPAADEQPAAAGEGPGGDNRVEDAGREDAGREDTASETAPAVAAAPTAEPDGKPGEPSGAASAIGAALSGDVPAPAASVEGGQPVAAKPTPAPRTESQAAHRAAQPTETTAPAEETAPSGGL